MDAKYRNLARKLSELDKKAQIVDDKIKEVRIGINNLCWSFIDLKKSKDQSSVKEKNLEFKT